MSGGRHQWQAEEQNQELTEGRMGFLEHLDELRTRLIRSALALGAGMFVAYWFVERISNFILAPTLRALAPGDALILTKPGEGFSFYLDVAFLGGMILASPYVMYQVWRFIAPGLYAREKRFVVPLVIMTAIATVAGAAFTHYVLFPTSIAFLGTFHSPAMKFMPRLEDTFDLYKGMMLGMVAVFQMPTLIFFLAKIRLVTARWLWRNMGYAILAIFTAAAALTTSTDAWNQVIFAAPMIVLYLISIVVAWIVAPSGTEPPEESRETTLRLVVAAGVLDHARRIRRH